METKHPTRWAGQVEERVLLLLKRFGLDAPVSPEESAVRVMSFSARSLHRVRAASPTLPTVFLTQFVTPRMRDGRLPEGSGSRAPRSGSCAITRRPSGASRRPGTRCTCGP